MFDRYSQALNNVPLRVKQHIHAVNIFNSDAIMICITLIPVMVTLSFALATPNLITAVLCLTSNVSENLRSGFLALRFFTYSDWLGVIGLLPLNTSSVDTIRTSRISVYCC